MQIVDVDKAEAPCPCPLLDHCQWLVEDGNELATGSSRLIVEDGDEN
jgi:hypothetical protein